VILEKCSKKSTFSGYWDVSKDKEGLEKYFSR
jgi:hypothetical protein